MRVTPTASTSVIPGAVTLPKLHGDRQQPETIVLTQHDCETFFRRYELLRSNIPYGHRWMGKSSILRNLGGRADPGTLLVYLDMQDAGRVEHTGELPLDLAEALHQTARRHGLDADPSPNKSDYASQGAGRRAQRAPGSARYANGGATADPGGRRV